MNPTARELPRACPRLTSRPETLISGKRTKHTIPIDRTEISPSRLTCFQRPHDGDPHSSVSTFLVRAAMGTELISSSP